MGEDFEQWEADARAVWERIAPSYVKHDVPLPTGYLRELFDLGARVDQFEEALELAFDSPNVTKRWAIYYALGIVRRLVGDSNNG